MIIRIVTVGLLFCILILLIIYILFYSNTNMCKCLENIIEKDITNNSNIMVKQLFNERRKLIINSKTKLAVDGYISYLSWNYIDTIVHNLIFQLKYVSGLWSQNLTGKAIVTINNHIIVCQYKASYDNTNGKMIIALVDQNNKQLTASGDVKIKLSFGINKNIATNTVENPVFTNINNAPTMCRNF